MTTHRPTRAGRLLFIERWRRATRPALDPAARAALDRADRQPSPGCLVQPSPPSPIEGDAHELARACLGEALMAVLAVMDDARASPSTQVAAARLMLSHGCGRPPAAAPPAVFDSAAEFARVLRDAGSLSERRARGVPEDRIGR
jgi:hypothetical protein